jgi:hypothetical protein
MEGKDGDAVLLGQVVQVGVLVSVPVLVHHDLDPVVPHFGRPAVRAIQAKRVKGASAEDDGDAASKAARDEPFTHFSAASLL